MHFLEQAMAQQVPHPTTCAISNRCANLSEPKLQHQDNVVIVVSKQV
jgi:hypothetical protein